MIETYLNSRKQLGLILLLLDIRHTPTENDKTMHMWIKERNIPYIIVATKADKISRSQMSRNLDDIRTTIEISETVPIIPISSNTKQGKDDIWEQINKRIITYISQ